MQLRIDQRQAVPLACGTLALALTAVALVPLLRPVGWNITALARVAGPGTPMGERAHAIDPTFKTVPGGYDGQFNWGIGVDPIGAGYVHNRFDDASYRYGHPLMGWTAWLASAGQRRAVPGALLAICLVAMFAAGALSGRLGQKLGGSGWEGLFVALNPGLIFAATHDLTEPLSATLMFAGMLAYFRGRRGIAAIWFALLILSKEQFILVPAGLALWDLLHGPRRPKRVLVIAASVVPAAAWWIYARLQFGDWFTRGSRVVGAPLAGWRRTLTDAGVWSYARDYFQFLTGEAMLPILVALLGLLAIAGARALARRGPIDFVYVLLGILAACLAYDATYILRDALRNVSVMLTLVPFVLASAHVRGRQPPVEPL